MQQDYDPKIHGVGTHPVTSPQTTKELHAWVNGIFNALITRIEALEAKHAVSEGTKALPEAPAPNSLQ